MTEIEVGTFGREAAVAVEAVGRRLIEAGLGGDGSLLTPGEPIWTLPHLDELERDYVDKPDTGGGGFFEKLQRSTGWRVARGNSAVCRVADPQRASDHQRRRSAQSQTGAERTRYE